MKVLTFVGVMLAALSAQADSPFPKIEIQTFETHSRIVVPVDPGVQTVWSSTASGFDLLLKDISLLDLGIPFGSEKSWVEGLDQTGDQRVGHITVAEEPAGVRIKGHWKYPGGDKAPADPAMVTFDYHNRIPPTYVVDFWQKAGPTLVEARKAEKRRRQLEALKVAQATAERRVRRRVASLKRQHDVADAGKYCKEPLGDERDVFVEFRPARQEIDFGRWFPVTTPDADYPYYEPKGDTEEDQYLKLALDLYRAGKLALAVRTAEFFNKEHPGSALSNEMKFMRANAMLKLGLGAEAERLLKELVVDAPGSPAALHAGTYMAVKAVRDKNSLGALESFLWLYKHYPNHRLAWVFQLGSAEAMFELRQTEKASKAYQWVVENAPDKAAQAEAALRIGDLFLDRGQYAQALAAYFKGLKYYGDQSDSVPTALVNRAETLYWLGQYDRAEQAFKEYLDKHSGHPSAWRAAFRLGEILGRKGGDDFREQSRAMFFQTINRFPFSPGATLARLRLIPCGDHGGFDLTKANDFLTKEATQFDGGGEVVMERYNDLLSLAHVRALVSLDHEDQAIQAVTERIPSAKDPRTKDVLVATARVALRQLVTRLMDEGHPYEALVVYKRYDWVVPASGDPSLFDFMLRLSREAADLGLGSFAEGLASKYASLGTTSAGAVPGREPATRDAESEQDIEDRLKEAEQAFSRAKALWVDRGVGAADDIRHLLDRVTEESPYSAEKQVLLGLMDEKAKQYREAVSHVAKAELLVPAADWVVRPRLKYWMARLTAAAGDETTALKLYSDLQAGPQPDPKAVKAAAPAAVRWNSLGLPALPGPADLAIEHAMLHETAGRWAQAAAAYKAALDAKVETNRILFGYARALAKSGDPGARAAAKDALKKIAGGKEDDFWKKLVSESAPSDGDTSDFQ